jgi:transposase
LVRVLWPHLTSVRIDAVHAVGHVVRLDAHTDDAPIHCPNCATPSNRAHSRYDRQLADTATAGQEVLIRLRVRRLFCDNTDCAKKTFAEQVPS